MEVVIYDMEVMSDQFNTLTIREMYVPSLGIHVNSHECFECDGSRLNSAKNKEYINADKQSLMEIKSLVKETKSLARMELLKNRITAAYLGEK